MIWKVRFHTCGKEKIHLVSKRKYFLRPRETPLKETRRVWNHIIQVDLWTLFLMFSMHVFVQSVWHVIHNIWSHFFPHIIFIRYHVAKNEVSGLEADNLSPSRTTTFSFIRKYFLNNSLNCIISIPPTIYLCYCAYNIFRIIWCFISVNFKCQFPIWKPNFHPLYLMSLLHWIFLEWCFVY